MSISATGFLSPDIARYVTKHRAAHQDVFRLADALNGTAQALIMTTKIPNPNGEMDRARVMVALLLVRTVSNFQGCIILCERGLIVESRTLARSCFESAACLTAIAKHGDTAVQRMVENTIKAKKKRANAIKDGSLAGYVDDEQLTEVQAYLDENAEEGKRDFSIQEMANLGDLGPLYIFYRQLSADAAHPSIEALERYYNETVRDGAQTLLWGPEIASRQIDSTVLHACCFMISACNCANDLFGNNEIGTRLAASFETYKTVMERYSVASPARRNERSLVRHPA